MANGFCEMLYRGHEAGGRERADLQFPEAGLRLWSFRTSSTSKGPEIHLVLFFLKVHLG